MAVSRGVSTFRRPQIGLAGQKFRLFSRRRESVACSKPGYSPQKSGQQDPDPCADDVPETGSSTSSVLKIPTDSGQMCLEGLFSHWRRVLEVHQSPNESVVIFPGCSTRGASNGDAAITVQVESCRLVCVIDATTEGQLEHLKRVLVGHLSRFFPQDASTAFEWVDL